MEDKVIHIARAEQDPDVPKMGEEVAPCTDPECPGDRGFEVGYGMAGGGMGVYRWCPKCDKMIDKDQDPVE